MPQLRSHGTSHSGAAAGKESANALVPADPVTNKDGMGTIPTSYQRGILPPHAVRPVCIPVASHTITNTSRYRVCSFNRVPLSTSMCAHIRCSIPGSFVPSLPPLPPSC